MATPAEIIDWIEAELMDDINFRDIPAILADARERFDPKGLALGPQEC